jgi:hypothetical protein
MDEKKCVLCNNILSINVSINLCDGCLNCADCCIGLEKMWINKLLHWSSYNQLLVKRGEILFSYDFLDMRNDYLARMNENKKGKPYSFPDSFCPYYWSHQSILSSTLGKHRRSKSHKKGSSSSSMLFTGLR